MPAKVAFAVLNLRKVHACIMELPRSKSVQLARKAAYLNYIEGAPIRNGGIPPSSTYLQPLVAMTYPRWQPFL